MKKDSQAIQIKLREIVRQRLGRWRWVIPSFLIKKLERLIRQDDLNRLLRDNYPAEGADFCRGVLRDLDVELTVRGEERLPSAQERLVVIVCNHPLGGLDGMALIDWASSRWGGHVNFIVNDLLNAVVPLRPVFVPINKHGSQSRESIRAVEAAFASDDPVLIFPAGLCSRRGDDGRVADLEWQKMFVNKAIEHQRDIVPLYFEGENSQFFYKFARIRKKIGIKFNLEMIYLPGEVFKSAGSRYTLWCGSRIPWTTLKGGKEATAEAARIRQLVYSSSMRQ